MVCTFCWKGPEIIMVELRRGEKSFGSTHAFPLRVVMRINKNRGRAEILLVYQAWLGIGQFVEEAKIKFLM